MENRSVFFGVAGLGAIAAIVASLAPRVVPVPQPAAARAAAADSAELRASARHSDPLCGPGLSQGARAAGRLPRTSTLRRTLGVRTRCGDRDAAGPGRVPPRLGVRLRARSDPPRLRAVGLRHPGAHRAPARAVVFGIVPLAPARPAAVALARRSRGGFGAHGEWVGNEPRQAHDAYFRPRAVRGDPFQFRRPRPTLAL